MYTYMGFWVGIYPYLQYIFGDTVSVSKTVFDLEKSHMMFNAVEYVTACLPVIQILNHS